MPRMHASFLRLAAPHRMASPPEKNTLMLGGNPNRPLAPASSTPLPHRGTRAVDSVSVPFSIPVHNTTTTAAVKVLQHSTHPSLRWQRIPEFSCSWLSMHRHLSD
eukprot:gnl/TRDRNA2_/TRDRNA2_141145_c0_seq1.p1 gnl/TRDRNA2_/TRDRNA2_141145_c0~~gnl/TRDRNA2_/TRDRNA2_141145_c0_seq1.p1  ORF type:complete len:105 (+),score=8.57 gnl/TRDRNA2_/TRDRNA2_141145_c0_seq1:100-414(+)